MCGIGVPAAINSYKKDCWLLPATKKLQVNEYLLVPATQKLCNKDRQLVPEAHQKIAPK